MDTFLEFQLIVWREIAMIMSKPDVRFAMAMTAILVSGILYFFNNLTGQRVIVMISASAAATLGLHALAWITFHEDAFKGNAFRSTVLLDLTSLFVCIGICIAYGATLLKPDPIVIPLTWAGNLLIGWGNACIARASREHAPEKVERVMNRIEHAITVNNLIVHEDILKEGHPPKKKVARP